MTPPGARYRWILHQLWIAAGNEALAYTQAEPHYNGFPAVLVRLPAIDTGELEELIIDAWSCRGAAGSGSAAKPATLTAAATCPGLAPTSWACRHRQFRRGLERVP